MNLSNTLFKNISFKLKLIRIKEQKNYIKNLLKKIDQLKTNKKLNYQKISSRQFLDNKILQKNLTIHFILSISFLKTNTIINLSDTKGNVKLFYSSGNVGFTGKQKVKRKIVLNKLITLLLKNISFKNKTPIALHLNNVKFYKQYLLKKLKKSLFITIVKSFNLTSYNGCRKRKMRRKKYTKKFI